MADQFELLDPQDAQGFLMRFPREARQKGEYLARMGRVEDLAAEEPGLAYSALVTDEGSQEVYLSYDERKGWGGDCTCEKLVNCEHVFAAMNALLAEHRMAAVRGLSSGAASPARWTAAKTRPSAPEPGELAHRLMTATGRGLDKDETSYLRKIEELYTRCSQTRQISSWDLQQLGFLLDMPYSAAQIWPSFPVNAHEFWLYIAAAVQEHGGKIPRFMEPITDLNLIQERLHRWRRNKEIESWKNKLNHLELHASANAPATDAAIDLQVVISEEGARLAWKPPGRESFEVLKQNQLRQLIRDSYQDELRLTFEGELIWHIFGEQLDYSAKLAFELMEPSEQKLLGRLLRVRLLESRIVNPAGKPLARPSEPLRWEVTAPEDPQGDYSFRLVQADGQPPPPISCVLPGRPALYLSGDAVFTGPDAADTLLKPGVENCIPAPALERSAGLGFLQSLGAEPPARLKERIRNLPYQVAITCELRNAGLFRATSELCSVMTLAEAPDGRQQKWTGQSWLESKARSSRPLRDKDAIVVYDTSALAQIPALLAPLNLKPAGYGPYGGAGELTIKVTKKFGEIFAAWLKTVPPNITVNLNGELASFTNAEVAGHVKLDVTEVEMDWFDLRVVLDVADTTLTQAEIALLLNAKGGYVRLKGKGWRRLHYDLGEEEDEKLARLGVSPHELTDEPQRLHALQLADEAAKKFLPTDQVEQIQRRASEIRARVTPDLPAGITAQLRPYQLEGFHFLAYLATNRFGGILADDMGLGKTLQALAWLLWLRAQPQTPAPGQAPANGATTSPRPSLVVCPKSVMDNWHAEAARFTAGLRVRSWRASELDGFADNLDSADLHVINYSQLRSVGERLRQVRWLAVILDEGQYIKNPNSQTAQEARALAGQHRLVLSGTPIENRLLDLWSIMAFAMPGILSSRAQFGRIYDAKGDPFARRRLASRVRPFVLRRTKTQVAKDLPDRIEEDLFCEIEGEQKTLYRAELKRAQQLLLGVKTQKQLAQQQFHFLTSLLRLRQICCDPRLMKPDSKAPSAKVEALLEQLEPLMEEGHKVLVFSQFVEMLNLLRPALEERKWPIFYLAGHTENRGELVKDFQAAPGAGVFLISLKAGGFGLNLTAASYVVLFDPWWNPAVESQAIDRTHRIGQTNNVIAYRLLIKDSIEEKIRALQKQKKALAEDVLGEEKFAQSLTLADLQFLFAD